MKNVRYKFAREQLNNANFPLGRMVSETIKGDELCVCISYIGHNGKGSCNVVSLSDSAALNYGHRRRLIICLRI
jgi:hypothetical protein